VRQNMKSEPTKTIKEIMVGKKDHSGYKIIDVLAKGNEYAIYEIDHEAIDKKLRFTIDGKDDQSEEELVKRYNCVKVNYIKAKGLLYRASHFGMMKNRVAHALATAFTHDANEANKQFEDLIQEINKEYVDSYRKRITYIAPAYIMLLAIFVVVKCFDVSNSTKEIYLMSFAAIIGAAFSLTINLKNIRFEIELSKWIYVIYGVERIMLAIFAGGIALIGIKSKFIFGNIENASQNIYSMMFISVLAGFSEKFIPSLLSKYEKGKKGSNK
jgi:hypothetical protein